MKRLLAMILLLILTTGCALGADMSDVRGHDDKAEEEYQYLILGTYPYEEDGTEAPLLWRILGREGDVITLFTEYIIDVHQVTEVDNYKDSKAHKFKKAIKYEESDLCAWVNGEMAETILKYDDFSAAIVEAYGGRFHIMDNDELRRTDFGFPDSVRGTTSENPGEVIVPKAKNRKGYGTPYAKTHVLYPDWENKSKNKLYVERSYGNSSAYWTARMRTETAGIVGTNGHLSWSGYGDVQKGVRPALLLDLTKLRITGGQGTLEDPWRMEVVE